MEERVAPKKKSAKKSATAEKVKKPTSPDHTWIRSFDPKWTLPTTV